jgi:hemerythrin-like domain-containing protein
MTGPITASNARVHDAIARALETHRLDVMRCDAAAAARSWAAFASLLERHIADEDELIRPIHQAACEAEPAPRGGSVDIVDRDHDKLRRHLEEIGRQLAALTSRTEPAAFLALLDRQKVLVDLLEHHDLRETDLVYPRVDAAATPERGRRILARFDAAVDA